MISSIFLHVGILIFGMSRIHTVNYFCIIVSAINTLFLVIKTSVTDVTLDIIIIIIIIIFNKSDHTDFFSPSLTSTGFHLPFRFSRGLY